MEIVVPDDQLSLAIGKRGQNVRLAVMLTGWRIDIKSETKAAQEAEQAKAAFMHVPGMTEMIAQVLINQGITSLAELADTVPRKEVEAAESEAASLAGRIAALGSGLAMREALVAPVAGVIASAHAVAGQVVDARELVFEIVDPTRNRSVSSSCSIVTVAVDLPFVPTTWMAGYASWGSPSSASRARIRSSPKPSRGHGLIASSHSTAVTRRA